MILVKVKWGVGWGEPVKISAKTMEEAHRSLKRYFNARKITYPDPDYQIWEVQGNVFPEA